MITRQDLNEDQLKSLEQIVSEGVSEQSALEMIEKWCIQNGYTGLRVRSFSLTPAGQATADMLVRIKQGQN